MPFGPKRTAGISGHYSEAWAIALQLRAEACGSWWKHTEVVEGSGSRGSRGSRQEAVGDMWEIGKGSEGVREVRERCGRCGRGAEGRGKVRKRWKGTESNSTLQYLPLKAEPSRPKDYVVINKVGRKSLVLHTHHHPK